MNVESVLYLLTRSDEMQRERRTRKVDLVARKTCQSGVACVGADLSLSALEKVVHVAGDFEPAFLTVRSVPDADATLVCCRVWISLMRSWQVCTGVSHR